LPLRKQQIQSMKRQRTGSIDEAEPPAKKQRVDGEQNTTFCKFSCGHSIAPGLSKRGNPFDTCCRDCAVSGTSASHDSACMARNAAFNHTKDHGDETPVWQQIRNESRQHKQEWISFLTTVLKPHLPDALTLTLSKFYQPPFSFRPTLPKFDRDASFEQQCTVNEEVATKCLTKCVSDCAVILCGYTERLVVFAKRQDSCLFMTSRNKVIWTDESELSKFLLSKIKPMLSLASDSIVFRHPVPMQELMAEEHCGCFKHFDLFRMSYTEAYGVRVIELEYDTEGG